MSTLNVCLKNGKIFTVFETFNVDIEFWVRGHLRSLKVAAVDRHSYNGILIGIYTCPAQRFNFEWPWVTLSDVANYSVTWSMAQPLCDSWAAFFFFRITTHLQYIEHSGLLVTSLIDLIHLMFAEGLDNTAVVDPMMLIHKWWQSRSNYNDCVWQTKLATRQLLTAR